MQLTMLNTQQIQKDLHDMNEFVDREEKLRVILFCFSTRVTEELFQTRLSATNISQVYFKCFCILFIAPV